MLLSGVLLFAFSAVATVPQEATRDGPRSHLFQRETYVFSCHFRDHDSCDFPLAGYATQVCYPVNATKTGLDPSAPCPGVQAILGQCLYGPGSLDSILSLNHTTYGIPDDLQEFGNVTQRDCLCGSQFFAMAAGCSACYTKHGISQFAEDTAYLVESLIRPLSSTYCAASSTPTLGFYDYLQQEYPVPMRTASSVQQGASVTISDSIGNKTAVSLYFTPSITGSSAWFIANPTASPKISNGQIVATAVANAAVSRSGSSGSISTASQTSSTRSSTSATPTSGAETLILSRSVLVGALSALLGVLIHC